MTLLQAIVLAIVQGVTEFLPISSTAHLILVPWFAGWRDQGLTFDVALHAGTLVAVLGYFVREWWRLLHDGLRTVMGGADVSPDTRANAGLLLILAVGTIPGALSGYLLEDYAETVFRNPLLIAGQMTGVTLLMWWADRRAGLARRLESVTLGDGIIIGLAQAVAVVPGTSRAGITITAALFRNLTREAAARFSFLLATPIIGGAALKKGLEVWQTGWPAGVTTMGFAVGFAVSAVVGYAAIAFLLRYLQVRTLKIFVAYRLALGVIIVAVEFLRS